MSVCGTDAMVLREKNLSTRRRPCRTVSTALSTTDPTWTALGLNPGPRGERAMTKRTETWHKA